MDISILLKLPMWPKLFKVETTVNKLAIRIGILFHDFGDVAILQLAYYIVDDVKKM